MAFPQVFTVARATGNATTTHTVTLPSSQPGNLLLAIVHYRSSSDATGWQSGWTQLFKGTASGNSARVEVQYKVSDGTEGSSFTFSTSGNCDHTVHVYSLSNYVGTPEASTSVTAVTTTPNPASLNPAAWGTEDTLWFAAEGNEDSGVTASAIPTNYGDHTSDVSKTPGIPAGSHLSTCRRELNAASEDPGTFTITGSKNHVAVTVAVRGTVGALSASAMQVVWMGMM